jgi:hypothetical protein
MEKVKFLGIDFDVMSDEEQANVPEGTVYMMIRVEDTDPRDGSPDLRRRRYKTLCDECRAICWLDPKSFGRTPAHVQRLCAQCVLKRAEAEKSTELSIQAIRPQTGTAS